MKRLYISILISIIISVFLIKFVLSPAVNRVMSDRMNSSVERYYRDLSKGVYYLLQQDLKNVPQAEWKQHVAKLQVYFGYPISIRDYHDLRFSRVQLNQLLSGNIVIIDNGKMLWQRIGNSNHTLGMGPLAVPRPGILLEIMAWSAMIILMGTVFLIWVFPFWRKLKKVTASAIEFGNGDFGARANISPRSALAPLAGAFNSMAERIQSLIQSHKELTNAVSHELRTPIARIRFGLEMMKLAHDEKGRESYAKGIQRDVDELEELVNELLACARFDRENTELQHEVCNIASWLEELTASFKAPPVKVRHECLLQDRDMKVRFDVRQMGRAVGNLLQNAAKYGNGEVRVTLEREWNCISIHVDDNGPGIPETERIRIFEPFSRLDSSRNRGTGGFGLGLAIVRRVALSHGGTATVSESDLGGSRFTIKWAF